MTPDERNLLTRFLGDLNGVKGVQKDPEAAGLISQAMNSSPDAPYLLVQHAILADQALATAQARIAELEDEVRRQYAQNQTGQDRGFLGGLFGGGRRDPPPQPRPSAWGGAQPYTVVPQTQPYQGGFFGGGAPAQPGGMGSFLQNAGATAAGVAGGAFLFEGLSNLFGGHHGGGFGGGGPGYFGGDYGGGGYGGPSEVVNNYYEGGSDQGGGSSDDGGGSFGGGSDYDAGNGDPGGGDYS